MVRLSDVYCTDLELDLIEKDLIYDHYFSIQDRHMGHSDQKSMSQTFLGFANFKDCNSKWQKIWNFPC
jgi:hypothetical protein